MIKDAKPNQKVDVVRCNREFVITVIVITEFDCRSLYEALFIEDYKKFIALTPDLIHD